MSKTFIYCLVVIGVFLFIVKPVNKKEDIAVEDSHIANDFESAGIEPASHKQTVTKNPLHTI